jgi:hypothetical protein
MTLDGFRNITHGNFENGPLSMWGRTLTYYAATVSTDPITGDKTISYGAGTSITGVLHKREQTRIRSKDGFIDLAPAYLMVLTTVTVAVEDKIKDNDTGEIYKVHTVLNRLGMYTFADLMFWEDT